jgi:Ca2+-transporting ATPase
MAWRQLFGFGAHILLVHQPRPVAIIQRPPRDPKAPLFGMGRIFFSLFEGLIVLLAVLLVLGFSLYRGYGEDEVRAVTFATLVVGMLGLIFVNRSRSQNLWRAIRSPNRAFSWVVGRALAFLAGVIHHAAVRVFRLAELDWLDLMIAISAGWLAVLRLEIVKLARREPPTLGRSRG